MKVKYNHKFKDIIVEDGSFSLYINYKISLLAKLSLRDKRQLCYIALQEKKFKLCLGNDNLSQIAKMSLNLFDKISNFKQTSINNELKLIRDCYNRLEKEIYSTPGYYDRNNHDKGNTNNEYYALSYFLRNLKIDRDNYESVSGANLNSCLSHSAHPDFIKGLLRSFLRNIKQFNVPEHNNTYYEPVVKEILAIDYYKLQQIDKNQLKDMLIEHYNLEDKMNLFTYKAIQREFEDHESTGQENNS